MFKHKKKIKFYIYILITSSFFLLETVDSYAKSKQESIKEGNILYSEEKYIEAAEKYSKALEKDTESDIINYNLGTAYYKRGDYIKSQNHLQKSLLTEDKVLKQKTYYNLGNSFYKEGISKEKNDINYAIFSLEKSLSSYEQAIKLSEEDEDAKFNYEFVKKELDRLRKKLEEQQKQDKQKEESKSSESNGNNQTNENKQQENQTENKQANQKEKQNKSEEGNEDKQQGQEQQTQKDESEQDNDANENKQEANSSKDEKRSDENQPVNAHKLKEGEITKEEAENMLQQYLQTEEPKGMINFYKLDSSLSPVIKDW